MRLKTWLGPAIVLAVVLAGIGYWNWWQGMAQRLETGFAAWVEARRAEGIDVDWSGRDIGGFPYRLTLGLDGIAVSAPARPGAPAWSARRLEVHFQPWERGHAIAGIAGRQSLAWSRGDIRHEAVLEAESTYASIRLDAAGGPETIALDAREVAVSGAVPVERMERFQLHVRFNHGEQPDRPAGSVNLGLHADGLRLREGVSPVGPDVSVARVSALARPFPGGFDPAAVDAWRDAGGVVDVLGLEVRTGALAVTGDGSVALDAARRPEAAGVLVVRGADAFVDALSATGVVQSYARIGLQIAIAALEKPDPDGGRSVSVPWSIQDGQLELLGLKLLRVQPLY